MAFCTNCGQQLSDGAKFCSNCGTAVNGSNGQRKTVYNGEIHKCPNCGEVINAFSRVCPSCSFELRGSKVSESAKEFSQKYEAIKSNDEKIDLIRTFAIPNTREDILEFMILTASNIDGSSYMRGVDEDTVVSQEVTDAWMAKFEQVYYKANLVLQGDPYLDTIERIYTDKKASLTGAKKKAKKEARRNRKRLWKKTIWSNENRSVAIILLGGFAFIFLFWALISIPSAIKERKLEKQVVVIENLIDAGDYEAALRKAEQLYDDSGWSTERTEKWDTIRESLISDIKELQNEANGMVKIPLADIHEWHYTEVETLYQKAGFTNVTAEKVPNLIFGWLHDEGETMEVIINGDTNYVTGTYVEKDAEVIIKYYGYSD